MAPKESDLADEIHSDSGGRNIEASRLRLISWNMRQQTDSWEAMLELDPVPDVALLQEAVPLDPALGFRTSPAEDGSWTKAGT